MPLQFVHVNGSVNLPDTETVLRELASHIPKLAKLPDGETGPDRKIFMEFLEKKFQQARGLERIEPNPDQEKAVEIDYEQVRLADGVDPMAIEWPEIGYCAFYEASWKVFQKLEREGVIAPGTRFQVQYSTPLAGVSTYVRREDALLVEPSYERALFADLDRLLSIVPHDRIAVQWDLPLEIGVLEAPGIFGVSDLQNLDMIAGGIARCVNHVPADVPVGMHLCYGDAGHQHWKEPTSIRTQVDVVNAIASRAKRPITWAAFTVPQYVREDSYFAPLADLTPALAEPYLALVPYHPGKQEAGTTGQQVQLVDKYLGDRPWGICTECGLSGVDRAELPALLDLHSDILRRYG